MLDKTCFDISRQVSLFTTKVEVEKVKMDKAEFCKSDVSNLHL